VSGVSAPRGRAAPAAHAAAGKATPTASWLEHRLAEWRATAQRLQGLELRKSSPTPVVLDAIRAYPEIARDLAIARRAAPGAPVTKYLEGVYLQLHRSLFRPPTAFARSVWLLFSRDAADVARTLRAHIAAVAALFIACVAAGGWLVSTYPELATLFASEQMIEQVQRGELWTDDLLNVFPSSLLSAQIFTNNIVVSLFAVCLGVFYGLGTFYIIGLNGLMLGGVFAFTAQHGIADRLFRFVVAHGFVELSVVCIAGAVGASLGEALTRPGNVTRGAAFQAAVRRGMRLMAVCVVFLVGAGLIEGFVSPDPRIPLGARLAIGLGYFALFALVLSGALGRLTGRRIAAHRAL
jgi:uncharacterized membrane protein SpoIIM required for sporulation